MADHYVVPDELAEGTRLDGSVWQFGRLDPMPPRVPSGWRLVRLTTVARLESGHTPSRREPTWWGGDVPWVSLADTHRLGGPLISDTAENINAEGLANSSARILPAGTVVVSRTATVGKVTILGRDMATSQDFANYVCGPEVNNVYLMQLLRFMQPEWQRLRAGSTHNTVYLPVFKSLQVLLPPLDEQRRIAAALSAMDALHEQESHVLRCLIATKDRVASTLIDERKPSPPRVQLGELVRSCDYGISTSLDSDPSGVIVLRMGNVSKGEVDLGEVKYAPREAVGDLLAEPGDVLFNRTNSAALVGKVGIFRGHDRPVSFASYLLRLRPQRELIDGRWLGHALNTARIQDELRSMATPGVSQVNINRRRLLSLELAVPSLRDQQRAADLIDAHVHTMAAQRLVLLRNAELKTAVAARLLRAESAP